MITVPSEQPPDSVSPELTEYLARLIDRINASLSTVNYLPATIKTVAKPRTGQIVYASQALDVNVNSEGFWGYTSTGWVKLG
jgi:hypothetical protein